LLCRRFLAIYRQFRAWTLGQLVVLRDQSPVPAASESCRSRISRTARS
jgi:hypothetical protein